MTNRELLDYYKVCNNRQVLLEEDYSKVERILNSNISIKKYIETVDLLFGVDNEKYYNRKWNMIKCLFYAINEEDLEESIDILCETMKQYQKILNQENFDRAMDNLAGDLGMCIFKSAEQLRNIKVLGECNRIKVSKRWDVNWYEFFNIREHYNKNNIRVLRLSCGAKQIDNVGVITLKGKNHKIINMEEKEDINTTMNILKEYDYDIAITTKGIAERLRKEN